MTDERLTRSKVPEAMRAMLSDDHNYERGLAVLRDLVDDLMRKDGPIGLREFTVALALVSPAHSNGWPTSRA